MKEQSCKWMPVKEIGEHYGISKFKVMKLCHEMSRIPKFANGYRDLGYNCKRIDLYTFDEFLEWYSMQNNYNK